MPSLVTRGDRIITLSGRESSLARSSVPLAQFYGGGSVNLIGAGPISFAQLYEQQPWVKICVDKLAHQIATLPLKVYETDSQNGRTRVLDSPLANLLAKPWPRARPVHLKQKMAFSTLLHGNSLLAKVREQGSGSTPFRLSPLDWRYLSPECHNGDLYAWKYTKDGTAYIAPEETIHFFWESPDGVTGTSPLMPLGITIALEKAAQEYAGSNFEHGVTPSVAITLDKDARNTPEFRKDMEQAIESRYGGQGNSGKPLVVGGGATITAMSHTAREAELIEFRKLNREEVAAGYDIPPPMIGILDKATYSNIYEQHRMLYMTVLRPWLTLFEETIEAHMIDGEPAFEGERTEFDLAEVLKGDAKERAEAFKLFLESGVYTINELRKLENQPPIKNALADQPLIPANNLKPLSQVGQEGGKVAATLASHLNRAARIYSTKTGAGQAGFDAKRFMSELAEDLAGDMGSSAESFAGVWAAALEQGVVDAGGDHEQAEQFLFALAG